jgi:prepilin-type N-terminal cleavage/methylation domain-containing protein
MKTALPRNLKVGRIQNAFTLAEVMVAVAVIAVMFVSLYLGITFGFSVTDFERQNLRATQIMLQRLEGIRLLNWGQLGNTAINPTTFYERYYPASGSNSASGITYTGAVEVAAATLDPMPTYSDRMRKITVTVTWQSGPVLRRRSASTYSSQYGLQNYIYAN